MRPGKNLVMGLSFWLWGMLIALGGGCLVCLLNYTLSRTVLWKKPSLFAAFTIIRQVFNVGYLVVLYFVAPLTPWDRVYLLLGGALGVTLPMIYFTVKLVRLSDGNGTMDSAGESGRSGEKEKAGGSTEQEAADSVDETEVEKHG